jgi:hypothetical protein
MISSCSDKYKEHIVVVSDYCDIAAYHHFSDNTEASMTLEEKRQEDKHNRKYEEFCIDFE